MLFERRVADWSEGCVVDAFEVPVGVEPGDAVQDVEVGFVSGADDQLRGLPHCPSRRTSLEFVDPLHGS